MNDIVRNTNLEDDPTLRPSKLTSFTGQSAMKKNLSVYVRGAKRRKEPLDHTLFYGPPGLGKTTLSRIIAEELDVGFRSISAPSINKAADLAQVLVGLEERDVLFIDEIHRLPLPIEELLYSAMEDFLITINVEQGIGRTEPIEVPIQPFTLVGATTRKGLLSAPLQDRFGITLRLNYYEHDELSQIIVRAATLLGEDMSHDDAMLVAERARGTPRIALRILKRLRDFREDEDIPYSPEAIGGWLNDLGITPEGFDEIDQAYLRVLRDKYKGGPVGLKTLATDLSESEETIESSIEPYLIRLGVLSKTPKGRVLMGEDSILGQGDLFNS